MKVQPWLVLNAIFGRQLLYVTATNLLVERTGPEYFHTWQIPTEEDLGLLWKLIRKKEIHYSTSIKAYG